MSPNYTVEVRLNNGPETVKRVPKSELPENVEWWHSVDRNEYIRQYLLSLGYSQVEIVSVY